MPFIFSYGTLRDERVQLTTYGRRLEGTYDELVGFEPSTVQIAAADLPAAGGRTHYANVTFTGQNASRVAGMVFEITDDELTATDRYELTASYTRVPVVLASGTTAW